MLSLYIYILFILISGIECQYLQIGYYPGAGCQAQEVSKEWFLVNFCQRGNVFRVGGAPASSSLSSLSGLGGLTSLLTTAPVSGSPLTSLVTGTTTSPLSSLVTGTTTLPSSSGLVTGSTTSSSGGQLTLQSQRVLLAGSEDPTSTTTSTTTTGTGSTTTSSPTTTTTTDAVTSVSTTTSPLVSAITRYYCLDTTNCAQNCYAVETFQINGACALSSENEHVRYSVVDSISATYDRTNGNCWAMNFTIDCTTQPQGMTEYRNNLVSRGYKVNCTDDQYNYYNCVDFECDQVALVNSYPLKKCLTNAKDKTYNSYLSFIPAPPTNPPTTPPATDAPTEEPTTPPTPNPTSDATTNVRSFLSTIANIIYYYSLLFFDLKKSIQDLTTIVPYTQFLKSVRIFLATPPKTMRTSALRVIRYYTTNSKFIQEIVSLKIHYFITRCLERDKHSETERIQALKLVRTIMEIDCSLMPPCIVKSLVAIAENQEDNFCRVCLETLCEISIRNPQVSSHSNGIRTLFDSVLDPFYQGIQESLLISILYILNEEKTRVYVRNSDLEIILSPLTNSLTLGVKIKGMSKEKEKEKEKDDEINMKKWVGSNKAVVTLLKSWIGIISLASDEHGLKSIVDALKMPQLELHDKLLESLFEIFRLVLPKNTGDPFRPQKQSQAINMGPDALSDLPSRTRSLRHNLLNNYIAVLLIAFIECGLIEGLVHLGNTTQGAIMGLSHDNDKEKEMHRLVGTKATVLLGTRPSFGQDRRCQDEDGLSDGRSTVSTASQRHSGTRYQRRWQVELGDYL
ncbi:hypothetical protein DFA_00056 [Cavenderia fasciculata]|uniref:Rapamycin-insensitive companion of mTOR N-terminal domain-containing protein n=1 Tax=Cavenderia fasciculata TaxID=261658 RepID=F4PXG9_CACFS|nr:uncharacterized protein DFA_00056 [Cavenderia fasciculata]EGG19479.1 hypothetical protein DFA_00056 [Cavenderia fasciculata]|eukprot:XP_004357773.1 hypothetical protein DFA_00056 [Cavenderia fasciculata]